MISVRELSKTFQNRIVLDSITFSVPRSSIMGFIGPNGAGKSTTLDILAGVLSWNSGTVEIAGFDLKKNPLEGKKSLGYLPDGRIFYEAWTVEEFLLFISQIKGAADSLHPLIEQFQLGDVLKKRLGTLSKGFLQRVGLVQALIGKPQVLLLDEPTDGLDPFQMAQLRQTLTDLSQTMTILVSSHVLSELEKICDQMTLIKGGKILHSGPLPLGFASYEELFLERISHP
jgi:ABC-2 type transport system ATP-binding protein